MSDRSRSVLYVGGTGTISASCVAASVDAGMRVTVLNRGLSSQVRPVPEGVNHLEADAGDASAMREALRGKHFDAVVNVTVFNSGQADDAVKTFADVTDQYVHISTAAMYRKPVTSWPIVESTPTHNPFCLYAREKIGAERVFTDAHAASGFPVTIVRPSHTYDDARPPLPGDWAVVERIARGEPVVVPGDGTSVWTVTHAEDFAVGLVGLLGNPASVGETFHITSDFFYTWDQIYRTIGERLGKDVELVHVPSELIALAAPDWMWSELLTGDLSHSAIFDNTKIRRFVPAFAPRITFVEGTRRFLEWRDQHPDLINADSEVDKITERVVRAHRQARDLFAAAAQTD